MVQNVSRKLSSSRKQSGGSEPQQVARQNVMLTMTLSNTPSENRTTLDIIFCTTKVGFYLHSFLISRPDKLALAPGDWCQIKHGTRPDRSLESNNSWSISGDWASSHRAQDCVSAHAHF